MQNICSYPKLFVFQQNAYNSHSHYSVPGIFYPPPFATRYFPGEAPTNNIIPASKESSREQSNTHQNGNSNNSTQVNSSDNHTGYNMDDEQQYESASIIYGPGIQWPPSPSPLHHATQAAIQYPPYVDYYHDYQNEGSYFVEYCITKFHN